MGRRRRGSAPGAAAGLQVSLHSRHAREQLHRRARLQPRRVEELHPAAAGSGELGGERHVHHLDHALAEAERRRDGGNGAEARRPDPAHAARHPARLAQGLGRSGEGELGQVPDVQEGLRVAARVRGQGGAREALHVPAVFLRRELLLAADRQTRGRKESCGPVINLTEAAMQQAAICNAAVAAGIGLALAIPPGASAQDSPWYIGGSIGQSRVKLDTDGLSRDLAAAGMANTGFSGNETDTGFKLFGGYRFHPNFAVEGGYAELGKFSASGTLTTLRSDRGCIWLWWEICRLRTSSRFLEGSAAITCE